MLYKTLKKIFKKIYINRMICATNPGNGACQGDSGGPLVSTGSRLQYGIVSAGKKDCNSNYPGIFANVAFFRQWIQYNTGV